MAEGSHLQQLPAKRQQGLAAAVSQEAEETDAHEAMREHMQKKAAQKLLCGHRHQLLFAAAGIILPAERHLAIGKVDEAMIRDS